MISPGFWLLCAVTFLAAFLLFQIELIIAKLFLPSYGGSYLVWGACVVFFQAVLLAGYCFAHHFIARLGLNFYRKLHLFLLLVPFVFFPGTNINIGAPAGNLPLVMDVFLRLLLTIGPVFFVLSTVSLVTQAWLGAAKRLDNSHPYVLYAVSNIGSFLALWSYPFLVELFLSNTQQLNAWRLSYVVLVILSFCLLKWVPVNESAPVKEKEQPVYRPQAIRWFLLSTAAVMLFLAVTNLITYEVAPIPLLWIMPLSIYLLSFVLAFKPKPWYPSWMKAAALIALPLMVALYFQARASYLPAAWAVILFNGLLFVLCLHIQHELIKSRPAAGAMTLFYVIISFGGFCGGFLTSWVIPLVTKVPSELLIGLFFLALGWDGGKKRFWLAAALGIAVIADGVLNPHHAFVRQRNYYGIYEIYDRNGVRTFVHGTTLHGLEWTAPERQVVPLGYYSPNSPMGEVFIKDVFKAKRVGAVGLGTGTMAVYSKPDMPIDFYELDPDVVSMAKEHFHYLRLSPGEVRVAVGDARVSLSKIFEAGGTYDLLVIDAFGGDAIPFHLLNRDVVGLYHRMLNDKGGILFHIPNRYFNLEPVVGNIAADLGAFALIKEAHQDGITLRTFWAVMTWDKERFAQLVEAGWRPLAPGQYASMRTWSDDYSSALPILKLDELWQSLKHVGFTQR